jgi:putative transposase
MPCLVGGWFNGFLDNICVLSFIDMNFMHSHNFDHIQHPYRQSIRLSGYNYTQPGAYFITICTHEHHLIFGRIANDSVLLNPLGKIAQACWLEITQHFAFTEISTYVIMPNHIHGIIVINNSDGEQELAPQDVGNESFGKPVSRSLPTIIRSFKSAVTKRVNTIPGERASDLWQKGYYEHVIRGEKEWVCIGEYILSNPMKWTTDRENPDSPKKEKPMPFEY